MLLPQIVSDVTGVEQSLPEKTVGAAYGDAFFAGLATGLVSRSDLESSWVRMVRRFVPDPNRRALYSEYYTVYRSLYPHIVDDLHTLARLGQKR